MRFKNLQKLNICDRYFYLLYKAIIKISFIRYVKIKSYHVEAVYYLCVMCVVRNRELHKLII